MADTKRLRRHGPWAVVPLAGLTLGLALAAPAPAAEPPTTSSTSSTTTTTSTTSTSTSTSTSTTTTTTSTTVAPPPVTSPGTSTLIPPLVNSGDPVEIGGAAPLQRQLRTLPRTGSGSAATGPTLPFTGNGTLGVFAAGLAALAIGALALWWGSRARPEIGAGPEARG